MSYEGSRVPTQHSGAVSEDEIVGALAALGEDPDAQRIAQIRGLVPRDLGAGDRTAIVREAVKRAREVFAAAQGNSGQPRARRTSPDVSNLNKGSSRSIPIGPIDDVLGNALSRIELEERGFVFTSFSQGGWGWTFSRPDYDNGLGISAGSSQRPLEFPAAADAIRGANDAWQRINSTLQAAQRERNLTEDQVVIDAFADARRALVEARESHAGSWWNASVLHKRESLIGALFRAATLGAERVDLADVLDPSQGYPAYESAEERNDNGKRNADAISSIQPLITVLADAGMSISGLFTYHVSHEDIQEVLQRHRVQQSSDASQAAHAEGILESLDHESIARVTDSALLSDDTERRQRALAEIERQLTERGVIKQPGWSPQSLARDEILSALCALGEDPSANRVDAVHALVDVSALPVSGRDDAVREAVDLARRAVAAVSQESREMHNSSPKPCELAVASRYELGQKYSGLIPEIKYLPVRAIERQEMDFRPEVMAVSDEIASNMDYSEPVEVTAFRYGKANDDTLPVVTLRDGHHRTAAAIQTGREHLPVVVRAINAKGEKLTALIAMSQAIEAALGIGKATPPEWTTADCQAAAKEGWNLFNIDESREQGEIQGDDEDARFATDEEAIEFVRRRAQAGDVVAAKALRFHEFVAPNGVEHQNQPEAPTTRGSLDRAITQAQSQLSNGRCAEMTPNEAGVDQATIEPSPSP
jgi:hypothetical protein